MAYGAGTARFVRADEYHYKSSAVVVLVIYRVR